MLFNVTSSRLLDPALAAVADALGGQRRMEVATLVAVLDWCAAHEVSEAEASVNTMTPGLQLGGPGCPWVSEFDAHDLACVLGRSPDSCAVYVGNALVLRHRLPRLWARVVGLEVPLWKGVPHRRADPAAPHGGRRGGRPRARTDRAFLHVRPGRPHRHRRARRPLSRRGGAPAAGGPGAPAVRRPPRPRPFDRRHRRGHRHARPGRRGRPRHRARRRRGPARRPGVDRVVGRPPRPRRRRDRPRPARARPRGRQHHGVW